MFKLDSSDKVIRAADIPAASPDANRLAAALLALVAADAALIEAKREVPNYTAQWNDADYYGEEQDARNKAAEAYLAVVKEVCAPPAPVKPRAPYAEDTGPFRVIAPAQPPIIHRPEPRGPQG